MPRKPLDPRLIILAGQATTEIRAFPSLEPLQGDGKPYHPGAVEPWPWCDVTVRVSFADQAAEATISGRTFANETDFKRSETYQRMQTHLLTDLLAKLETAADALAMLGPAPRVKAPTPPVPRPTGPGPGDTQPIRRLVTADGPVPFPPARGDK